jgi:hypothetical protein
MSPIEMRIRLLHVSLTSTRAELRQALLERRELLRVNRQLGQELGEASRQAQEFALQATTTIAHCPLPSP